LEKKLMFSNGAFDCKKCPKTRDQNASRFCPAWWEEPWYKDGKEYIRKECSYVMLPDMLRKLGEAANLNIATAHRMNDVFESNVAMCKEVSGQMEAVAKSMMHFIAHSEKQKLLEKSDESRY